MRSLTLLALAALPLSAFAQKSDSTFDAAVFGIHERVAAMAKDAVQARAQAAAKAAQPAAVPTCEDARKDLERRFQMEVTLPGEKQAKTLWFAYAGCREEGRNDYLPPYTEREYAADGGYALTIVTNENAAASEVLLSKGQQWLGRFVLGNGALASGAWQTLTDKDLSGRLRGVDAQLVDLYPQLKTCEVAAAKSLVGSYMRNIELMLLTEDTAYYYYEDCDICAALDACDLKTGAMKTVQSAHMLSCSDVQQYKKGAKVLYSCK